MKIHGNLLFHYFCGLYSITSFISSWMIQNKNLYRPENIHSRLDSRYLSSTIGLKWRMVLLPCHLFEMPIIKWMAIRIITARTLTLYVCETKCNDDTFSMDVRKKPLIHTPISSSHTHWNSSYLTKVSNSIPNNCSSILEK